jgi:hypothetical protein
VCIDLELDPLHPDEPAKEDSCHVVTASERALLPGGDDVRFLEVSLEPKVEEAAPIVESHFCGVRRLEAAAVVQESGCAVNPGPAAIEAALPANSAG